MRRVAPLLAVCLVAGCGSHAHSGVPVSAARTLVLQQRDLPAGYTVIGTGAQNPFTATGVDPKRFGREGGWYADYRRPPAVRTGALIVQSQVDVFGDSGGADRELEALRARFEHGYRVSLRRLGDESFAFRLENDEPGGAVVYTVGWRQRNVASTLVVTGLKGKFQPGEVAALARRAAAHVAAAR